MGMSPLLCNCRLLLRRKHDRVSVVVAVAAAVTAFCSLTGTAAAQTLEGAAATAAARAVAAQCKSNYEKISTWQGTVETDESSSLSPEQAEAYNAITRTQPSTAKGTGGVRVQKYLCTFAVDRQRNRYFCEKRDVNLQIPDEGKVPSSYNRSAFWRRSVVSSQAYLHIMPLMRRTGDDGKAHRLAHAEGSDELLNMEFGDAVDPREFFRYGVWAWQFAEFTAERIEKAETTIGKHKVSIVLSEENGARFLTVSAPWHAGNGNDVVTQEAVYGLSCGGSLIAVREIFNDVTAATAEWEYQEVAGVFIPTLHRRTRYVSDGKGIRSQRAFAFRDCRVNESIDEKMLTWEGLGLEEGDKLYDNRSGTKYVVRGGKLVDLVSGEPFPEDSVRPIRNSAVAQPRQVPAVVVPNSLPSAESGMATGPARGLDASPHRASPVLLYVLPPIILLGAACICVGLWRKRRRR